MKARPLVAGLSAFLAVSALPGPSASQQPTPSFRAEVEYVEVDTLVLDKDGNFVRNLAKEDFRIFEDGKPQTISTFALVDIRNESVGPTPPLSRPVDTDVQSNERPFDGRVYVLILDDLHTQFSRMPRAQAAARQFIERNLGANDLMAVVSTGAHAQNSQLFTPNKRLLMAAVDGVVADSRLPDNDQIERVRRAQMTLGTLRQVAASLGSVRGRRKTMIFFSEGLDFDFAKAGDGAAADVYRDFLETAVSTSRANVTLYAIDPRGLGVVSEDAIALATLEGPRAWLNPPPIQQTDANKPTDRSGPISQLADQLRISQRTLQSLAEETGGFAAINRNDYSGVFTRIVRDSSSYYVLAYHPPPTKQDNKLRRIEVKVSRPGLTVHARRGYVSARATPADAKDAKGASAPRMPADLRDALNSPLPASGLSMRVSAAPFMGSGSNASVVLIVEMLGRDLTLGTNGKVEVSFLAVDANAKMHGARNQAISLDLQPETRARVEQTGIRLLNRVELPPGRYQLRVAARDLGKANVGAVIYDLEVPDFASRPISLSGLTVTSLAGAAMFTPRQVEQLKAVLPAAPIALRTFRQNDELALFVEVYDHSRSGEHEVTVVSSVLSGDGRVVYETEETIDSSDLDPARRSYAYSVRISLREITPGGYALKIEARSSVDNTPTAIRQIAFTVAPSADGAK